ncbi:hypothetical protein TNCV_3845551 [Trichonephila clavipes]|nr:hypothetical protein TNCV_3845551 [Trichonephila clavipes]
MRVRESLNVFHVTNSTILQKIVTTNPDALKCGLNHQTKECEIQRVEQMFCINCQTYGHMANYAKCPQFPKPKKGSNNTNSKNTYSNVINSIVRPNVSYASAAKSKLSQITLISSTNGDRQQWKFLRFYPASGQSS